MTTKLDEIRICNRGVRKERSSIMLQLFGNAWNRSFVGFWIAGEEWLVVGYFSFFFFFCGIVAFFF